MEKSVDQFVAVTGASVEDARNLLEACGGNLDLAVNMHMERGGGGVTGNSNFSKVGSEEESYEELHGVRAPIPQTSGVLIDEVQPTRRSLRSRQLPATVFDPFLDYSKATYNKDNDGKLKSLADLFKPPFDLLFTGTFEELRTIGQTKKRWLLINLQDSKQFASQVLNRDVWSHEGVKAIVSEHFLFWQIHKITDDGLRFVQLYHVNSFPYVAILDPRTGEKLKDWDTVTVSKFIPELTEFLHNNKFDDDEPGKTGDDGVADMSEEEQLQAAIRASLRDIEPSPHSNDQQNRDSDEYISLSDEEGDGDGMMEEDDERVSEKYSNDRLPIPGHTMVEINRTSQYVDSGVNCDPTRLNTGTNSTTVVSGNENPHMNRRKRKFSCDDEDMNTPPVKMACRTVSSQPNQEQLKTEKGAIRNRGKGKQRAVNITLSSVEERLKSGELQKIDVSYVVIRLPDGSRMEKVFMRNSPIAELFTYLSDKGIDTNEHEIVTNFPRRALKELDHLITFQEANFYPSVTVFVQD